MVWFCLSFLLVLFNLTPSWFLHVISAFVDDFFSKCSHIDTYFLISEKKISNIMFISSMMCTPFYEKEIDKSEPKFHTFELSSCVKLGILKDKNWYLTDIMRTLKYIQRPYKLSNPIKTL